MKKAEVGDVVHYVSWGSPLRGDGSQEYTSQCRAAVITAVHSQEVVGLAVLNPSGMFFHECVRLSAEGGGGTWHWREDTP